MTVTARTVKDNVAECAAFIHDLRTGRRVAPLEYKFNPNHDPDTGRFTTAEGSARSAEATQEAQLSPARVARGAAMALGLPADALGLAAMNIVGAPLAPGMLPGTEQRDLNAKVGDILRLRKASIKDRARRASRAKGLIQARLAGSRSTI